MALSGIGLASGSTLPENAAALVGAGVLSVLAFPGIAVALQRRAPEKADPRRGGASPARPDVFTRADVSATQPRSAAED